MQFLAELKLIYIVVESSILLFKFEYQVQQHSHLPTMNISIKIFTNYEIISINRIA